MNPLHRHLAPLTPAAWKEIDLTAKKTLKRTLAARRFVDFIGPFGWEAGGVNTGHRTTIELPVENVEAHIRVVQPMFEIRVPFEIPRDAIESMGRGAKDTEISVVVQAARTAAQTEDQAIFYGFPASKINGMLIDADSASLRLSTDYEQYPLIVASAINNLRMAGVAGPYALALGARCYQGLTETLNKGGYPIVQHVRRLLDGPLIWAPAIDGAVVLSLRGGDFELTVGQDFSIGYADHSVTFIELYLQETFAFRTLGPEAAVPLKYTRNDVLR